MRQPFRKHIADRIDAARRDERPGGVEVDLAAEAIRMARIATAVHLAESARLLAATASERSAEVER